MTILKMAASIVSGTELSAVELVEWWVNSVRWLKLDRIIKYQDTSTYEVISDTYHKSQTVPKNL